jgi:hypothetical protein
LSRGGHSLLLLETPAFTPGRLICSARVAFRPLPYLPGMNAGISIWYNPISI